MSRFLPLVAFIVAIGLVRADDPPKKLTLAERKALAEKRLDLDNAASQKHLDGKPDEAIKLFHEALAVAKQLYTPDLYPNGHAELVWSHVAIGYTYLQWGKPAEAEPFLRTAVEMDSRLYKSDHKNRDRDLTLLGMSLEQQAKFADAEHIHRELLASYRRQFKGDHEAVAKTLSLLTHDLSEQGKFTEAEKLAREALAMCRRMARGDDPTVSACLGNLADVVYGRGELAECETLFREALEMDRRLYPKARFPDGHPDLAQSLGNLAAVLLKQGRLLEAESLNRAAVGMYEKLYTKPRFPNGHPDLALALLRLAETTDALGKSEEAEKHGRAALAMYRKVVKPDDPHLAMSLNSLAATLLKQGKLEEAELLQRDAVELYRRGFPKARFPDGTADLASALSNWSFVLQTQGKFAEAEAAQREALAMARKLVKGDTSHLAYVVYKLSWLYQCWGKNAEADPLLREALALIRTRLREYTRTTSEGAALTLVAHTPLMRDAYLSNARLMKADPATVYAEVWAGKAAIARTFEQRQLAARAAATDPAAAKLLVNLGETRRRRAELILAPKAADVATREKRDAELRELDKAIAQLDGELRPLLPSVARTERLDGSQPADLQKVLPPHVAVIDFLRYTKLDPDPAKPQLADKARTLSYTAFVITSEKIAWVELGPEAPINAAVRAWRQAITSGKDIPAELPAKLHELVWAKVRKELPAGVKTVYISPDWQLCLVPWAAIPGGKPGTILLEDYAIATIPHATFLLDKLWPQDPLKNPPSGALVVGGVNYDAEPGTSTPAPRTQGEPLVRPGEQLTWAALPGAAAEATGVATLAGKKKVAVSSLNAEKATPSAVLAELPRTKFAHIATHGFFADASFRSAFQLDPKDFQQTQLGERVGRAALSPLVMTGLVFAGANNPKTPGRGVVTGEALVDLDLSGLELAVLSACETGVGDGAGGEGTFGLQRAFHLAGTRDVIASLWKVPDAPTAALMAEFYRNLWERNLSPMESLRQAQLTIYRSPGKIADLAAGFRAGFKEVPGAEVEIKPTADGKTHPRLWAAFSLSGPGR